MPKGEEVRRVFTVDVDKLQAAMRDPSTKRPEIASRLQPLTFGKGLGTVCDCNIECGLMSELGHKRT